MLHLQIDSKVAIHHTTDNMVAMPPMLELELNQRLTNTGDAEPLVPKEKLMPADGI